MSNQNEMLDEISIYLCRITEKTCWMFISIPTKTGLKGFGEATLAGQEKQVLALFDGVATALLDASDLAPRALFPGAPTLPLAALISAYDQALWDIKAKTQGLPLRALLYLAPAQKISVYANINRKTVDRSAAGFAASAKNALDRGHTAVKIAPFDEVDCRHQRREDAVAALKKGIARIDSVRSAIGDDVRLMVDCHWRLDLPTALDLLSLTEHYRLHWLECPVAETSAKLDDLTTIRAMANAQRVLLAGCEENIRTESFAPFWEKSVYDV